MTAPHRFHTGPIPKAVGADVELGNAWTGGRRARSNLDAAERILQSLDRLGCYAPARHDGCGTSIYGEWGRRWLKNGGCVYIDMQHVEICPPETASARNHAAAIHAMLRIIRACRKHAMQLLPEGEDLFVNAHNSDGSRGTSWGGHLNLLVTRKLWDELFDLKPHLQALAASFIAATAPVFGQGLLLPGEGTCRYCLSARAHHVTKIEALATTVPFGRSLLNSRDEAHARSDQARLHLIAFDTCLQPAAILLRTGLTQLFFAALEAGGYEPALLLDDAVAALHAWSESFDSTGESLVPTAVERPGGTAVDLVAWHRRLVDFLDAFVPASVPETIVPEGRAILDLWSHTLDALERHDWEVIVRRLDWALKWRILREHPACPQTLHDPALRLLDQYYGCIDERDGLFWSCWRSGLVEQVFDDKVVRELMFAGDRSTRSALRGAIVGRFGSYIRDIDWGSITLTERSHSWWPPSRHWIVDLPDPADPGIIETFDNPDGRDRAAWFALLEAGQPNPAPAPAGSGYAVRPYLAATLPPVISGGELRKGNGTGEPLKGESL